MDGLCYDRISLFAIILVFGDVDDETLCYDRISLFAIIMVSTLA